MPAKVEGRWTVKVAPAVSKQAISIELKQQMQKVGGMAKVGGREVPVENVKLVGKTLSFTLPVDRARPLVFSGMVERAAIEGTVEAAGARSAWSASPADK